MLALADAIAVNQGAGGPLMFRFHSVAARISKQFSTQTAASWMKALTQFRGGINETALRTALAGGNVAAIEAAVKGSGFGNMMRALEDPLARTARATGTASAKILNKAGFPMQFNAVHPNVVLFARDQAATLAVSMTADVREAVRTVVALGAQQGLTVVQQARAIREVVGLPPNWAGAPLKLGDAIRTGDISGATRRRLSAATKQEIRSQIKKGTVTQAFIEKMEARYAASLTNRRALNIARTETLRASNFGQQESWVQAKEQGVLPADSRRFWIVTPDDRLSPEHAQIPALNPVGRGMEEDFDTPDGPFLFPPSRTNCRCGIGLGVGVADGQGPTAEPTAEADRITLAQPSQSYPLRRQSDETLNRFQNPDGKFTAERIRLHDAIVRKHFQGVTGAVEDPQVMVMGGGPASGKSAMLRQVPVRNHVTIDVDEIRKLLPEFREGIRAGNKQISAMTHEESSLLGKRIAKEAIERQFNVLVDGTGDATIEALARKVEGYRLHGHRVIANYVSVDTETAVTRAILRGEKTGRFVPEDLMRAVHSKVSRVFVDAVKRGLFDEVTLWDTNAREMLKVARAVGKKLKIFDRPAYSRFLAKISEQAADPFGATHLLKSRAINAQLNKRYARYRPAAKRDGTLKKWQGGFEETEVFEDTVHFRINDTLRAKEKLTADLDKVVAGMDTAIAEGPTVGKDVVMWRGGELPRTMRVGDKVVDKGFVATSSDRLVAESFFIEQSPGAQDPLASLIRIGVPKGQRGLWMPKLVGGELRFEGELVLPRNATYIVRRIRRLQLAQYEAEFGVANPHLFRFGQTLRIVDVEMVQ